MIEVLLLGSAPVLGFVGLAAWLDHHGRRPLPDRTWDVLVVAGCRVLPDGRPSLALRRRTRLAIELYHRGVAPRIVLTGGIGRDAPSSEAACAADLCVAAGVPRAALILEERSTTTLENASFTVEELGRTDLAVLVVTDTSHTFRCRRMFGRHFRHVDAVGAVGEGWPRTRLALREAGAVLRHAATGAL